MITNSDQDILLDTIQQTRAIEKFRKELERVFCQQIAKHDLMKDRGFSFPIYIQAHHEDGGTYQYNYVTYFRHKFWEWGEEQQERQIKLKVDTALKKIIPHMISVGCDIETLRPHSIDVNLYDT